jgi:hypothetical protein
LVFGTTDGDGASFSDAYQGNSDRFPGKAEITIVAMEYDVDLGLQHQITKIIKTNYVPIF